MVELCAESFDWLATRRPKVPELHWCWTRRLPALLRRHHEAGGRRHRGTQIHFAPARSWCSTRLPGLRLVAELTRSHVDFVTGSRTTPCTGWWRASCAEGSDVLRDEVILLTSRNRSVPSPTAAHRVWVEEKQETLVFVTNNLVWRPGRLPGSTKSAGRSNSSSRPSSRPEGQDLCRHQRNAVQIQIWTALIAMLVLKYLQLRALSAGACLTWWPCCGNNCSCTATCGPG